MADSSPDPKPDGPDAGRDGWLERLIGRFRGRESMRDDLEEVLSEPGETGDLSPRERLMLKNVLGFHAVRISDVMVPRADIVAVSADTPLREVLRLFRTAGHSRLPAYGETLDEPLGMVHIRDFLDHIASGGVLRPEGQSAPDAAATENLAATDLTRSLASADILRPVLFVPRSMRAIDLLARMQASRTHMALVIDEYGGTDGLVSIEDLVETVVGDIEDEHDQIEHLILSDGSAFLVDARVSLEEVSEAIGHDLAISSPDEVDTLGGLIVTRAGRVPSRGEIIAGPGDLEFEVLDADLRRLKRVRIHRRPAAGEPRADGARTNAGPVGDVAVAKPDRAA